MSLYTETKGRYYQQVQSLRDLTKDNFPNGQIRFHWSIPAHKSWNPALSFYVIRHSFDIKFEYSLQQNFGAGNVTTTKRYQGDSLGVIDGIAPTLFFNDSLWQQIEMRINGTKINKQDNYCHQIAALKHRMCPEPKNQTMNDFNFHQTSFVDRAKRVGYGGNIEQGYVDLLNYKQVTANDMTVNWNAGAGGSTVVTFVNAANCNHWVSIGDRMSIRGSPPDVIVNIKWVKGRVIATTANTVTIEGFIEAGSTSSALGGAVVLQPDQGYIHHTGEGTADSSKYKGHKIFETIWKPKLGFFGIDQWLPGGEYELILTPFPGSQLLLNAIEWKGPHLFSKAVTPQYSILNMYMNLCMCDTKSSIKTIKFYETRCQAKTINVSSLSQKQLVINKKTTALTLTYQDNRINNSYKLLSSLFKFGDTNSIYKNDELKLGRFYIHYDGRTLPNPIPDMRYDQTTGNFGVTRANLLQQRYWESQFYKLAIFDDIETFDQWIERGAFYHFQWPRQNMGATEVQISQEFNYTFPDGLKPQLLLFEHYPCSYSFDTHMGYITNVKENH